MIRMISIFTTLAFIQNASAKAPVLSDSLVASLSFRESCILSVALMVLAVTVFFNLKLSYKNKILKGINKKLFNKDWKSAINVKAKKELESFLNNIDEFAICQFDNLGKITYQNRKFTALYGTAFYWEQFLESNFVANKGLGERSGFYKNVFDVKNDYHIQVTRDEKLGMNCAFIQKMNAIVLKNVATQRSEILESHKSSAYEALEESILKINSFKSTSQFVLVSDDNVESLCIYMEEEKSKALFEYYVRAINVIAKIKSFSSEIEIESTRENNVLIVRSFIPNIQLIATDLGIKVPFAGETLPVGDILRGIENLIPGYELSMVVKNIESYTRTGVCVELALSDLENVSVKDFEFNL